MASGACSPESHFRRQEKYLSGMGYKLCTLLFMSRALETVFCTANRNFAPGTFEYLAAWLVVMRFRPVPVGPG